MAETTTSSGISSLKNFTVPIDAAATNNGGVMMPKLKYRFRVSFTAFGTDTTTVTRLTKEVSEAARPQVDFENKTIDVYNSKINYPGKPTWKTITVKIRDTVDGSISKLIAEQNQKQFDFYEQSSAAAGGDFKFTMTIEMLDGGNGAHESTVFEKWECYGCYIQNTQWNVLTYSDASFMTIDLTIQPDNCMQTQGGLAQISGNPRDAGNNAILKSTTAATTK